jgi:dTMP kinase
MAGGFITFEGGEGAGKSTQVERLGRRLEAQGIAVVVTREPGGSPRAERILEVLLSGAVKRFGPLAEAVMFSAARADHLEKTVRPALARGAFVLCDRFADSTRAYQGVLGATDPALIEELESVTVGPTRPDLTFVLDLPAAIGLARAARRRDGERVDRFENEGEAYHERLRQAFLTIAEREPRRCVVVDAGRSPEAVEAEIWRVVEERLLRSAADLGRGAHAG